MRPYKLVEKIIDEQDITALSQWLKEMPQLTKGPLTAEFEKRWARWLGTRYAVFVNSGSSANLLMAYGAKLSGKLKNLKVVVPSVGWVTTVSPFIHFGFEPIMCGADPENFGLNLEELETILKKDRPGTVIYVSVLGVPGDLEKLVKLKQKYGFFLIEDACAALGAEWGGKKAGSFGDLSSFSFFFGHQLSTIEGGMVNTNDKILYDLLLMLRSHGWGKDLDQAKRLKLMKRHQLDPWHEPFTFLVPGFNLRNTEIGAFLGLRMMDKANKVMRIRKQNHLTYAQNLKTVEFQKWNSETVPCSISLGAIAKSPAHRKKIVEALDKAQIETRLFSAGNLGRHPFWIERYGEFRDPVSDRIHDCGFFLPNHESLCKDDVLAICNIVNSVESI